MDCIHCGHRMEKRPVRGILLDHCAACDAIWLDEGELEALQAGRARTRAELRAQERIETTNEQARTVSVVELCPRCQGPLFVTYVRGVAVDQCRSCRGMYFDQGELQSILHTLRGGRLARFWRQLRRAAQRDV